MSESRENSVLVALRELRGIEDDRVKKEQEAARARVEAERAAKEAAEEKAREEAERLRMAEADRVRKVEEDKQAKVREEQLRVEEAERRARVEGEMKLREEQMRLEVQSRAQTKSPLKAVVGVAVALVLVGGVVVYRIQASNKEERERIAAEQAAAGKAASAAQNAEWEKKLAAITRDMDDKLKAAKTDAEKEKIKAEAAAARREAAAEDRSAASKSRKKGNGTTADAVPKTGVVHVPGKRDINDNLLDGL